MESLLIKFIVIVFLSAGFAWGGVKFDREWILVKYNIFSKLFAMIFLFFSLALTHYAFTYEKDVADFVLIIISSISIISLLFVIEVYRSKAWFDEDKIYVQSAFRRKVIINYQDIVSCKWSKFSDFVITSNNGHKVRLSAYMSGIEEMIIFLELKISKNKNV